MASGITKIADVIVPEIFTPYVRQMTEVKSRLVQSGALARDSALDALLSGGGLTFNVPSWRDLDDDADNVSSDDETTDVTPNKIQTSLETAVRLSRNGAWSDMDLTSALAGSDPMEAIAAGVSDWWTRRLQDVFIATWNGVIADNVANDSGDYQNDVSGGGFVDGVTNFTTEAFLDALLTIGDSQDDLGLVMVHSGVYNRMQKNNLIDFIPDARGETQIPTFLGREVIQDDRVPRTGNVYDTWIFGAGATRLGVGSPDVPTEIDRKPEQGNGGGRTILHDRLEWLMHPVGHAYTGTAPNGGPSNAATANNLANAGSWDRVYPQRKQIKFARLVTREA